MARRSIAPPPTRFGAPPGRRAAAVVLPKSALQRGARPAIPPPPTRFGAAPVPKVVAALQQKPARAPAPPPTRFGAAPAQAAEARSLRAAPAAASRSASARAVVQPANQYGGSGGFGFPGGYGYGYGYYVPYAPYVPTTNEIESALQNGNDHLLVINRFQGYVQWDSPNFPGFNIEFYIVHNGVTLKAHVKWKWARWFDEEPYAMSLKELDNSTLQNPTQGSHPALWRQLAYEARKIIANDYAWYLLGQFGGRVRRTDIQQLITDNNRQGLYAIYNSDHTPLSVWDSDAWSLMLDWVAR